jgi:biotin carboxyl carrier protein
MENELRAETGGVVARVHAVPGAAVEKGAVLVEFVPPAEEED